MASFGRGYPPLIPVKQRCGAISADLLESPPSRPSQSRWQPQSAPAQSMPAWQPPVQPNVVTSGWQQGSAAQDSAAELSREPAVPQSAPSARSSPQPMRPGLPGSPTEPYHAAASAAQQQQLPLPAYMEEDAPLPAPIRFQDQRMPAAMPAQQQQMQGATQSWIPLTRLYPAQFDEAVPEPDTPPEAEAPRANHQAAHRSSPGAKRKHDGLNEGKGIGPVQLSCQMLHAACLSGLHGTHVVVVLLPEACCGVMSRATRFCCIEGCGTQLSHAACCAGHKKPKVVFHPAAAPARAPPVAGPPSKAKLAEEGEALGLEGAMHYRAVYHLADSPGVPMLDLKDLVKVRPRPL